MKPTIAFLTGLLACVGVASAQYADFALTGGYSHIFPERDGGLMFSKDGAFIDGDFAYRLPGPAPVFVGLGLTASGYYENNDFQFLVNNGNFLADTTLYSDVDTVAIEPRLAIKLTIPGVPGFFVRPRIGAGLLVDDYSIDTPQTVNNITYIRTINHTGGAFEIRPGFEAGWSMRGLGFGADFSYMAAWGAFGQLGDVLQEFRAGVFVRFRY